MMNYQEEKDQLNEKIMRTEELLAAAIPNSSQLKQLKELKEDIEADHYTVMVVGEFKHGKSTFVNALLGQDVMPRGVTPTTATINVVRHGETHLVQVMKTDGSEESYDSLDILHEYTASQNFDADNVKLINLEVNSPLLENRVVLIDTPGVNDLSEQRTEVTHQFLPRADVVIFMCSLTSPIKKSEEKFIKERLMKSGRDRIIYAANFMDRIDEDEQEELVEFVERRLELITEERVDALFPISAKEALDGRLQNDSELTKYSGIVELEQEIKRRIDSGSRGQEKINHFYIRLMEINEVIQQEIATAELLARQTEEDLENQLQAVKEWFRKLSDQEMQLQNYLYDREAEINFMVGKSVHHFGDRLINDMDTRIQMFQGADVKNLVKVQLPTAIRSQITQWLDQNEDAIQQLLLKLEKEVSQGLARSFNQSIRLQGQRMDSFTHLSTIPIFQAKSGNANVKAGLVLGGAGALVAIVGAPILLPLIGMAGLPLVSQTFAEYQLNKIKPELTRNVRQKLTSMINDLEAQLKMYINQSINQISASSIEEFNRLLNSYEAILQKETLQHKSKARNLSEQNKKQIALKLWIETQEGGKELYEQLG
ncbi:dynamin family protein [Planococcus lenghuensis]|uniref:Dynamin N-terminal domain-containing protein n=1 Tax=Planococcus lenghuensis TaxID=2213202 RepID=A0A1Q2L2Q8_9BACL|nr:dynamin family protein [Planococcus lenghuensis]AQQ54172.1 hypothetical protein B0X71_14370 [Planococcus lenghuensis]